MDNQRLLQNFSFATVTAKKCCFAARRAKNCKSLCKSNRLLQQAHQYAGSNPYARGGIAGISGESGIMYRNWFRLCCQYASAFFGLALRE
jgi:hypothetical protein